jgi:DNA-binding NarL/FixJ family response regulator
MLRRRPANGRECHPEAKRSDFLRRLKLDMPKVNGDSRRTPDPVGCVWGGGGSDGSPLTPFPSEGERVPFRAGAGSILEPKGEIHPRTGPMAGEQPALGALLAALGALVPDSQLLPAPGPQSPAPLRVALLHRTQGIADVVRTALDARDNHWMLESHLTVDSLIGAVHCVTSARHARERSTLPGVPAGLPDVVLVEAPLAGQPAAHCVRRLRSLLGRARILILAAGSDPKLIIEPVMSGAHGCLVLPVAPEHLVWAVGEVVRGRPAFCHQAQAALVDTLRTMGAHSRCQTLSSREREIMLLLIRDASDKDIATTLGIGTGTAHWHVNRILKKLAVHSRQEACRKFVGGGVNPRSPGSV